MQRSLNLESQMWNSRITDELEITWKEMMYLFSRNDCANLYNASVRIAGVPAYIAAYALMCRIV
jgi:hypothetical protein